MLDKPEKTYQLLAALRAAVPFEVELTPSVIAHLRAQQVAAAVKPRQIVTEVSYAGDEGGIFCHMAPEERRDGLIVSLAHVRVRIRGQLYSLLFGRTPRAPEALTCSAFRPGSL